MKLWLVRNDFVNLKMEIQRCHKEENGITIKLGEDFVCYHLGFDQLISSLAHGN